MTSPRELIVGCEENIFERAKLMCDSDGAALLANLGRLAARLEAFLASVISEVGLFTLCPTVLWFRRCTPV